MTGYRLTAIKPPAIIPGIRPTPEQWEQINMLWLHLWLDEMQGGDNLNLIAKRYSDIDRQFAKIVPAVARHFTHLMCKHYEAESDEYMQYQKQLIR